MSLTGPQRPAAERPRVVALVKNSFEYDARVRKEAASLVRAGCDVTVVALHVPGRTAAAETLEEGTRVVRVSRVYGRLARLAGDSTVTPGAAEAVGTHDSARRARAARLRVAARPALALLRAVNDAVVDRRMAEAALAVRPHAVHAHDLNTLATGVRVASATGARLVYDAHELHTHRNDMTPLGRWRAARAERRGLASVDAFVTATDAWADFLAGTYRRPRPVVVRNVPELEPPAVPVDLRAAAGIASDRRVLLYQGSVQTNRGIEQAVTALTHLPDCDLVVLGYGAHRPAVARHAAELGLADRVHLLGPVDNRELVAWTAGADVGLCCIVGSSLSYYWSLPNKLWEYALAGVPVVASHYPEMGAVVRGSGIGEVCDPEDPAAVAAAVRAVLDDRSRYAAATRALVERDNWGNEEQRLLAVYREQGVLPAAPLRALAADGSP